MNCRVLVFFALLVTTGLASANAEDQAAKTEFFEKRIRPVLVARCFDCHSDVLSESELRVDGLEHILRGGTRGPAIVPGEPKTSLLILAVNHADTLQMPPKQKIPVREIADLTEWVRQGAHWPNAPMPNSTVPLARKQDKSFTEGELSFWAFQRPVSPPVPESERNELCQTPIDRFWQRKLDLAGVVAAPTISHRSLLRRVSFDLTGLPPTMDAVLSFASDQRPDGLEREIDRLLASPRFGERWGRRWLDVARFADSNGLDENLAYATAYHYRDYVISVFNQDKPYDRFVQEQIAGDLLADPHDVQAWNDALTATGFLCVGAKMLAEDDPVKMQMDIIDEQVDTMGQAILGITVGCARCHDHKFDPIRTEDYYALAGIFKSTKTMENFKVVARWQERPLGSPEDLKRFREAQQRVTERKAELDRLIDVASNEALREARRHVGDYLLAVARSSAYQQLLQSAKPLGDKISASSENHLLLEAENYQRGNLRQDFNEYGKGIGVLVNRGETPNFAEYDIELSQSGLYQLELRYAAVEARPCSLLVDSRPGKNHKVATKTTGSWYPDSQIWFVESFLHLAAGKHTLRLEHPQHVPHIDKILLSRVNVPGNDGTRSVLVTNKESEDRLRNLTLTALGLLNIRSEDHYRPIPELVRQWEIYLNNLSDDADSPVRMWKNFSSRSSAWSSERPLEAECLRRIGAKPASLEELAASFNRLFSEIVDVWESLKGASQSASATSLPDAFSESLRTLIYDPQGPFARPRMNGLEPNFTAETKLVLRGVREKLESLEKEVPKLPEVMAVTEGDKENIRVHIRGSHVTLGDVVQRGFPRIMGPSSGPIAPERSGRLELANWLTDKNPLTSRVMANRIWLGHFGSGIVRSPDNFGQLGERPSHPELLDWLALRFEEDGWSIKRMHRTMMLSHCYRLGHEVSSRLRESDPENRLFGVWTRRRLEAEELRDAIIELGEGLDLTMKGTMLGVANRQYVTSTTSVNPAVYDSRRRSVYLPIVRSAIYEVFQAFDFPEPSTLHGQRESTTVASQALFMLNSPLVARQSRATAQRLLSMSSSDETRIVQGIGELLGRETLPGEVDELLAFVGSLRLRLLDSISDEAEREIRAWQVLVRSILSSNEFLYVE